MHIWRAILFLVLVLVLVEYPVIRSTVIDPASVLIIKV